MDKNLKILILVGIPASGKSTWARDFIRNNEKWIRVNRDDFRFMLKDQPMCNSKIEEMITDLQNNVISSALSKNLNVIIDNTNLKESYFNPIINAFSHKANIEFKIFDIQLEEALERDKNREKSVGDDVIKRMFKQYQLISKAYKFESILKIEREIFAKKYLDNLIKYDPTLEDGIICDIDGTLSIINRHPFDWKKVDLDYPNYAVIMHVNEHYNKGRKVILMSGRDCVARSLTEKWLKENNIQYHELHMRGDLSGGANKDFRKDSIIKKELYDNFVKDKYNVLVVYDDRQQVVDLWRKLGLSCFQVNESPD